MVKSGLSYALRDLDRKCHRAELLLKIALSAPNADGLLICAVLPTPTTPPLHERGPWNQG
jgi:hypothetical protein